MSWTEEQKIPAPPADEIGTPELGWSVALSADGNTALIGGPADNGFVGAAWVFTRSGTNWTEEQKITAPAADEIGAAELGWSVALSADGNTALIGGPADSSSAGAAWVFTRSGSAWSQQQKIPEPADAAGPVPYFANSVALTADGNTALIGGYDDNGSAGAAWVYTRSGTAWSEKQKIPAPADEAGLSDFGYGVALSTDGNTALIGGPADSGGAGAAWPFVLASPPTATIASPAAGGVYTVGQQVATRFACAPGVNDPGIASCADSGGAAGSIGTTGGSGVRRLDTGASGRHTYTVIATSRDGLTGAASDSYTVTARGVPVNRSPPVITGTPTAGQRLKCSHGSWTNTPTSYRYAWSLNGTAIHGATGSTYSVLTIDRGSTLKCTVTAQNHAGASAPASSAGVKVRARGAKGCPVASGTVTGASIGSVKLGITRRQARRAFPHSSDRGRRFEDFFCLIPIGTRVGYASPNLLRTLPAVERHALVGRVVWISTSNPIYAVHGIRAGATLAAARAAIHLYPPLVIGRNTWYLGRAGEVTAVLKVRRGLVQEVGIANPSLTGTAGARRTLMHSFR